MKIAYIVPGSGESFYCQNCFRDIDMLRAMLRKGQKIIKVPMYLPSKSDREGTPRTPVFYGAVNLYLREKFPFYRHAPSWLVRALDSTPILRYAAKKAGSTDASGLDDLTISMLQGEEGRQAAELDLMIGHLKETIKPDVVHLSNALLLGLAPRLKRDLGALVVCTLQDEDQWVDEMDKKHRETICRIMSEKSADVDGFIAVSRYFKAKAEREFCLPGEKIRVINGGIDLEGYEPSTLPSDPPVIGYLCRMSRYFGLDILVDAFLLLKEDPRFKDVMLYLTGGYTGLDRSFFNAQVRKITGLGYGSYLRIVKDFDKASRIRFLKSLTLLSVPVPTGEAFGGYQVEALAAGVPVVQPDVGVYPEFVEKTGGGLIYRPNTAESLAAALAELLSDRERMRLMALKGRDVVTAQYSIDQMVGNIIRYYENLLDRGE
jgi:glycosyltransferase involved in cell wall biosynthesis